MDGLTPFGQAFSRVKERQKKSFFFFSLLLLPPDVSPRSSEECRCSQTVELWLVTGSRCDHILSHMAVLAHSEAREADRLGNRPTKQNGGVDSTQISMRMRD